MTNFISQDDQFFVMGKFLEGLVMKSVIIADGLL